MQHSLYACPVTHTPLEFDEEHEQLVGEQTAYPRDGNIFALNPNCPMGELRDYYEQINATKDPRIDDDFFEERFDPIENYYRRAKKRALLDLLPNDLGVILDVGGGSGEILRSLIRSKGARFTHLALLDWARSQMKPVAPILGERDAARYSFAEADALHLPVRDGVADFIFNSEMIEHLLPEQSAVMLAELARALKPGGKLLITTPNGRDYRRLLQEAALSLLLLAQFKNPRDLMTREQLKAKLFRRYLAVTGHEFTDLEAVEQSQQIGHYNVLPPKRLVAQAEACGFTVEKSTVAIFVPLIVPARLRDGRLASRWLDRIEHRVRAMGLDWLFLACQMHLLVKR